MRIPVFNVFSSSYFDHSQGFNGLPSFIPNFSPETWMPLRKSPAVSRLPPFEMIASLPYHFFFGFLMFQAVSFSSPGVFSESPVPHLYGIFLQPFCPLH